MTYKDLMSLSHSLFLSVLNALPVQFSGFKFKALNAKQLPERTLILDVANLPKTRSSHQER